MALDPSKIYARYTQAKANSDLWLNMNQQAYQLTMPNRAEFAIHHWTPGSPRTSHVYDSTAIVGLNKFAANLQNLLMPSGRHWCHFKPGHMIMDGKTNVDIREATIQCDKWEDIFFEQLNKSNFQNCMFQAIKEMGISTGVMLLNEGTYDDPLRFKSIPLHQVSLEPGHTDQIENVFRKFKTPARLVQETWPKATLNEAIKRQCESDGSSEVELIEGTVYMPEVKGKNKYCYFVLDEASNSFILEEYRDYSPWIVFRWNVYAGEIFGRGPIIDLLPFIKDLNRMAEFDLRAASYNSNPIFMVASGSKLNPYTTRIEPGALIPVQPNGVSQNPIQQLVIQGNPNYSQLVRSELVNAVNLSLNINPIVPEGSGNKTATEVNIQNAEWMRENQAMTSRFERECNHPVVRKVWRVLNKFGYVKPFEIDDKMITVEYDTPVKDAENLLEIQRLVQTSEYINQILGPQYGEMGVMYGLDIEKIPGEVARKMGINEDLLRSSLAQAQMKQAIAGQMQGGAQNAQQQQPQQAANVMPMGGQ